MRIAVYSDLHLEHAAFTPPPDLRADVVVLAGDIHTPGNKVFPWARTSSIFGSTVPIVHVAGNHEFYGRTYQDERAAMAQAAWTHAIHHLNASVVIIAGVRFVGATLWTDFELRIEQPEGLVSDWRRSAEACRLGMNDYARIKFLRPRPALVDSINWRHLKQPLRPSETRATHLSERARLLETLTRPFDGPTVVVTHHAPHRNSLAEEFEGDWISGAFVSELREEFFQAPRLWIHGHTHQSWDYRLGDCRVVCNPRGYPIKARDGFKRFENLDFDPGLVVEV